MIALIIIDPIVIFSALLKMEYCTFYTKEQDLHPEMEKIIVAEENDKIACVGLTINRCVMFPGSSKKSGKGSRSVKDIIHDSTSRGVSKDQCMGLTSWQTVNNLDGGSNSFQLRRRSSGIATQLHTRTTMLPVWKTITQYCYPHVCYRVNNVYRSEWEAVGVTSIGIRGRNSVCVDKLLDPTCVPGYYTIPESIPTDTIALITLSGVKSLSEAFLEKIELFCLAIDCSKFGTAVKVKLQIATFFDVSKYGLEWGRAFRSKIKECTEYMYRYTELYGFIDYFWWVCLMKKQ
ncbi:hypothetical protein Tco_0703987 [Tanacetum coccineum]|uniref:Uncharacterized protein n=1 Tax=Tanacetum coccineum TaxID=301880 RepID=A0ABQ4Y1W3_9ASTR